MTLLGLRARSLLHRLWRFTVATLAVLGLFCVAGRPIARLAFGWMFERVQVRRLPAPADDATAVLEVTRGGFGTVWTTRVLLVRPTDSQTLYEARDSTFEPPLAWTRDQTLMVGLPCGPIDHLSAPGAHALSRASAPVHVRFHYIADCSAVGS